MDTTKKTIIEEFFINFFKAQAHLSGIGRLLIEQQGISFPCWRIISTIKMYEETCVTIPALADYLVISRQAVQRQIQILIREGLIDTCKNPHNKRSSFYQLTPAGLTLTEHIVKHIYHPWVEENFKAFDEDTLIQASEIFKRLTKLQHL